VLSHGGSDILVAKSEADLAEVTRITMSRDTTAEAKMYRDGTAFKVPDGTKVRVLERGSLLGGVHIKVLSGGWANAEGWTPSDYLN